MKLKKSLFALALAALLLGSCNVPGDASSESSLSSEPSSTSEVVSSSSETSESSSESVSSAESSSSQSSSVSSSSQSSASSESSSESTPVESSVINDGYWTIDTGKFGEEFRVALEKQITAKRKNTTSYSDCLSLGAQAARYPSNSNTFVPFYHSAEDKLTTEGACNREHTWPDSRGSGKSGPGADPFIIRPTIRSENSSRGNNFYGVGGQEWDPASVGFEAARGEAARVILYAATGYGTSHKFTLSNNPGDSADLKTMGTLKYLIQWNKLYAPTEMEIQINNYLSDHGYGRNPFVDHPEYADFIWSEQGLRTVAPGEEELESSSGSFEPAYHVYNLVDAMEDIDGAKLAIAGAQNEGYWYAMTTSTKGEDFPWYIVGAEVIRESTSIKTLSEVIAFFTFQKQEDGTYYIYEESSNLYLYNYIEDGHYSIGLNNGTNLSKADSSFAWNITMESDGSVKLCGTKTGRADVYLEYYRNAFCGYKAAPEIPLYLYEA